MRTLTLRLKPDESALVARAKVRTGEATASRALISGLRELERLAAELERLRDAATAALQRGTAA